MKFELQLLKTTRQNILREVQGLDLVQVNKIPKSFNNSIAWQTAHVIVTQQILLYKLSGTPLLVDDDFVFNFRKGSDGKFAVSSQQWEQVVSLLSSTVEQLVTDVESGKLSKYNSYETSYGITLSSVEEALTFNNVHEALHYGTIRALKKLL